MKNFHTHYILALIMLLSKESYGNPTLFNQNTYYISANYAQNIQSYSDIDVIFSHDTVDTNKKGFKSGINFGFAAGKRFGLYGIEIAQDRRIFRYNNSKTITLPYLDTYTIRYTHKNQIAFRNYMINQYINQDLSETISTYFKLGLGIAHIEQPTLSNTQIIFWDNSSILSQHRIKRQNNFIYSFGTGITLRLNPNIGFNFGMQKLDLGFLQLENQERFKFNETEAIIGINYYF